MFIDSSTYTSKGRIYTRSLLRHGYREDGKVKLKTIANISHCSAEEIEAIKLALKEKKNLPEMKKISESSLENGKFVGSLCVIEQVARELGITQALGESQEAKQIMWLICARLLEQGSRLSAVRAARDYAVGEVLGITSLNEDDLYTSLDWLYERKDKIEKKLFQYKTKKTGKTPTLFLYDVSSSYLEGEQNELAEYGYNRDKKSGKKQIVYGVLTDEEGDPTSIQVFPGNTSDPKTFAKQIQIIKEQFQCERVTLVGDKGMIKSAQIADLKEADFHYITTISKPQIEKLIREDVFQLELFEDELCDIEMKDENIRYILRRNPIRAEEMQQNRKEKIEYIEKKIQVSNAYLSEHPQSRIETQTQKLNELLRSRKLSQFVSIEVQEDFVSQNRVLSLKIDKEQELESSKLDGCYVMKTDLTKQEASGKLVHDRYKDLAKVEWEFRTQKTGHLEVRAIYVRKKERTIAHLFITMLAYKIERYLRNAWKSIDITVQEGLRSLSKITTYVLIMGNQKIVKIPHASKDLADLIAASNTKLPEVLPYKEATVITRKKLVREQ